VLAVLGAAHLEALMPEVLACCSSRSPFVREGSLTLFRFLPHTLAAAFQPYLHQVRGPARSKAAGPLALLWPLLRTPGSGVAAFDAVPQGASGGGSGPLPWCAGAAVALLQSPPRPLPHTHPHPHTHPKTKTKTKPHPAHRAQALPLILDGLSDESEGVRDAALAAGRTLVEQYAQVRRVQGRGGGAPPPPPHLLGVLNAVWRCMPARLHAPRPLHLPQRRCLPAPKWRRHGLAVCCWGRCWGRRPRVSRHSCACCV
jgi:hypothetical protein